MNLTYKLKFPDGKRTLFKEKLIKAAMIGEIPSPEIEVSHVEFEAIKQMAVNPKLHTIRADEKDRWRADMLIHHVYNQRTGTRDNFLCSHCVSTQSIMIIETPKVSLEEGNDKVNGRMRSILVDGKFLKPPKMEELALNDGFNSLEHFFTWFPLNYSGKIIHFTKLRY